MHLRILLLLILKTSFSSISLAQTSEKLNIEGTWSNTVEIDGLEKYGETLVISNDTILIKKTDGRGIFSKLQLSKYIMVQDTLVGTEIEYISFNSNLGYIEEHYKNRRSVLKFPMCKLRNDCAERGVQAYRKESKECKINWDYDDWLRSNAVKWPGKLKKDY